MKEILFNFRKNVASDILLIHCGKRSIRLEYHLFGSIALKWSNLRNRMNNNYLQTENIFTKFIIIKKIMWSLMGYDTHGISGGPKMVHFQKYTR